MGEDMCSARKPEAAPRMWALWASMSWRVASISMSRHSLDGANCDSSCHKFQASEPKCNTTCALYESSCSVPSDGE